MLNLYWKSGGQTRALIEKPFGSEAELEKYVFDNQDILGGDIYVIYRQIKTGSRQGIPDMLAVDQDARICIIELKNVEAGEDILPQALSYAIWAETNPDSIKAIWLESKLKPDDIQIDWDDLDIRVILIAPSFKQTVQHMAGKIGYPIDLIQVSRYAFEQEQFVLVEALDAKPLPRVISTKGIEGSWDWAYYESEHGVDVASQFRKTVEALDAYVKAKGWDVAYNLNKSYVGFKLGNRVIFGVSWAGSYTWKLELKVPPGVADGLAGQCWQFQTYSRAFKNAVILPLEPDSPDLAELDGLLVKAYQQVAGTK